MFRKLDLATGDKEALLGFGLRELRRFAHSGIEKDILGDLAEVFDDAYVAKADQPTISGTEPMAAWYWMQD